MLQLCNVPANFFFGRAIELSQPNLEPPFFDSKKVAHEKGGDTSCLYRKNVF